MSCRNHPDVLEGLRLCTRCSGPFCKDCLVDIQGRPYCATCKREQLLDVRSGVDRTVLNLAGIGRRFGAIFIDGLLINIPLYIVIFFVMIGPASRGEEPALWVNFIGFPFMIINIVYEGLMLQYRNGQTVGKKALNVRVVRPDGSPISPGQAWGRTAMRTVLGCLWIVDYIPAFFTQEKTTLHDMIANTRVVQDF